MSVWILHLSLTPEEESHLPERAHLPLPLPGMPDMTMVGSQVQCRQLVQALYPDEPPETVERRADRLWNLYAGVQAEDIIAVPLPHHARVALAEVTGAYQYGVGINHSDIHLIPVTWYPMQPGLRSFGKHKAIFTESVQAMFEVPDPQTRIAIRDKLPHTYNRFARLKWIPAFLLIMAELAFLARTMHR